MPPLPMRIRQRDPWSPDRVVQGLGPTCVLHAALMSVARHRPERLRSWLSPPGLEDDRLEPGRRGAARAASPDGSPPRCFPRAIARLTGPWPSWAASVERALLAAWAGGGVPLGWSVRDPRGARHTAREVFEALLGEQAHEVDVPPSSRQDADAGHLYPWRRPRATVRAALVEGADPAILEDIDRWLDHVEARDLAAAVLRNGMLLVPTFEFFERHLSAAGLGASARVHLERYYARFCQRTARNGEDYLRPARAFFQQLQALCAAGACVSLRTRCNAAARPLALDGAGRTTCAPGIKLSHEYEVVGVETRADGRCFIRVRDPALVFIGPRERSVELSEVLRVAETLTWAGAAPQASSPAPPHGSPDRLRGRPVDDRSGCPEGVPPSG